MGNWTRGEQIAAIMAILVVGGGLWNIIRSLLARDRKTVDKAEEAMWKRLDDLRKDLDQTKVDYGVLKEQVRHLPDREALHNRFQELQDRLDDRLSELSKQMREAFSLAATKFRCPHSMSNEETNPGTSIHLTGSGAKILGPLLEAAQREGRRP